MTSVLSSRVFEFAAQTHDFSAWLRVSFVNAEMSSLKAFLDKKGYNLDKKINVEHLEIEHNRKHVIALLKISRTSKNCF